MRHTKYFFLLLFSLVVFTACGGSDDDPTPQSQETSTISLSSSLLSMKSEGDSQSFQIIANCSWTITGAAGWISVSTVSGSDNASVVITAQSNGSVDSRTCDLYVTSTDGTALQRLQVTQMGQTVSISVDMKEIVIADETQKQQFNITSNSSWTITGNPEWLNVSPVSGTGNATVTVSTSSVNNSSSDRVATLTIATSTSSVSLTVTQKAGLAAQANVNVNRMVVLANQFSSDYIYDNNVSYYYACVIQNTVVERLTEDEIIAYMVTEENRYTPNDGYVVTFYGLDATTSYTLFLLGCNKEGKRGDLIRYSVTTKSAVNQPNAEVSDVIVRNGYWMWNTTIGAYAAQYYQWTIEYDADFYDSLDGYIAWWFEYHIKRNTNGSFDPILQSSSWSYARTSGVTKIQIVTWGESKSGELGGIINNSRWVLNSSSSTSATSLGADTSSSKIRAVVTPKNALTRFAKVTRVH